MEELTPFHQRKDLWGVVYEEHSGYIPLFLERFRQNTVIWKNNPMYDFQKIFRWKKLVSQPFLNEEIWFLMFLIKKKTERIIFGIC